MTDQKKILSSDIRYECGDAAYTRGHGYYQSGMVSDLEIAEAGERHVHLKSSVKGSGNNRYQQSIKVTWNDKYNNVEIFGYCSCPMHFNCKHVAAVCLKYRNDTTDKPHQSANHAASWLGWLETLNKQNSAKSPHQDFLAYTLIPTSKKGEFNLELTITREKKTGGLSKGRKTTVNNLRYGYASTSYFQEGDEELIRLITALPSTYEGMPIVNGATGYIVLTQTVKTGRLFYQSLEDRALKNGELRNLKFKWVMQSNGDCQLALNIDHGALLILTEPPMYLDPINGLIGPLNTHALDFQQLQKILTIPRIPAEAAEEFSERLALQHPDLPLPPPRRIEIVELRDLKPRPKLYLFGQPLTTSNYVHAMTVGFDYGGHTFAARLTETNRPPVLFSVDGHKTGQTEHRAWEVIKTDKGLIRIERNPAFECEALHYLTERGFQAMDWPGVNELIMTARPTPSDANGAVRWNAFIQDDIPELKHSGWLVEIDDSFLMKFQEATTWDAEIDENGSDWFEMRFNITVDGQSLPLLPLIMPALENFKTDQLPVMLSIPMGEHRYLTIPSERIKPFLDVLFELFEVGSLNGEGTVTMSRYNAAALTDLETHGYGLFSLKGGKALRDIAKKFRNFKGIAKVEPPEGLKAHLRDYQQQGLNWLQFLREYQFAGILADDMGLGKTVQTLAHILLEKEQGRMTSPCLIIAPTSLMGNWRREAERFAPSLRVLTLQGSERKQYFHKITDFDIVLTTYPLLPRDEDVLIEPDYHYLILDEAQIIKNPKAKASAIVRKINASHRLCLTGTPLENHLGELWAQFDFLMPGFLGDSALFKRIYRTPIETHGDTEQRKRLSRRLEPFLLRRTKQEVAKELPPKTEMIRSVPLDSKQAALYESIRLTMEKKVRDAIAQKGLARSHITILDALLKLRQTCCDPRTLPLKEAQKVKQSAKLDLLMEMLPELLEEGRRILVFSQFTKMIAVIEIELKTRKIAYSKLTGETKNRDEAINLFTGGEVDVFLISLKAGGVGLNLTEADTVIIYDPWWNPAVESQAADRAYRIGQDKPVFVYKLITENTVEEKILSLQDKKRALTAGVYQENNEHGLNLTAEDLTALFDPVQS